MDLPVVSHFPGPSEISLVPSLPPAHPDDKRNPPVDDKGDSPVDDKGDPPESDARSKPNEPGSDESVPGQS